MHTVQVTPIIGLPQFNGWSQVATNTTGSLVSVFGVAGLNAGNVGRDLVEQMSQSQAETATELHNLVSHWIKDVEEKGCQLEIAVAVINPTSALFAAYQGQILLKREQKVGTLLKADAALKIIQGRSVVEDVYVLATEHSLSFIGEIQQKLMQGYDIDTIVTSVVPAMHGSADSSLSSLGFATIGEGLQPHFLGTPEVAQDSPPVMDEAQPEVAFEPVSELPSIIPVIPPQPRPVSPWISRFKSGGSAVLNAGKRIVSFSRRLKNRSSGIGTNEVYVNSRSPRKVLTIIAVLAGMALIITGGLWWWRRSLTLQVQAAEAAIAPLEQRITQAQTTVESQPVQSRDEIAKAIQEMEALAPQFQKQAAAQKKLAEHISQAKTTYQQVSGREELKELQVFYDFSLVQTDFVAARADTDQKQAVFLDTSKRQIIWLDLPSKQVKTLPSSSKDTLADLTLGDSSIVVLGKGIDRLALTGDSPQYEALKEEGDSNREATLIGYFGKYLYAFNPGRRNIFRYAPEDDGKKYSDPIGWVKPGKAVPYDQINSWSIDGDMWLGTKDGKILKYTSGESSDFNPQGLPEPFTGSLSVFTRENMEYLYVLESDQQRIVMLRKTGEFIRQVKSPSLAAATTLIVSEELKKVLAISGSIIFEVPLD